MLVVIVTVQFRLAGLAWLRGWLAWLGGRWSGDIRDIRDTHTRTHTHTLIAEAV